MLFPTVLDELQPFRDKLIKTGSGCRPNGPDYMILGAVEQALDTAAYHFTGGSIFYFLETERAKARSLESTQG